MKLWPRVSIDETNRRAKFQVLKIRVWPNTTTPIWQVANTSGSYISTTSNVMILKLSTPLLYYNKNILTKFQKKNIEGRGQRPAPQFRYPENAVCEHK